MKKPLSLLLILMLVFGVIMVSYAKSSPICTISPNKPTVYYNNSYLTLTATWQAPDGRTADSLGWITTDGPEQIEHFEPASSGTSMFSFDTFGYVRGKHEVTFSLFNGQELLGKCTDYYWVTILKKPR